MFLKTSLLRPVAVHKLSFSLGRLFFVNLMSSTIESRRKVQGMNTAVVTANTIEEPSDVDPIDEMRLRTWARKNYAPAAKRLRDWHPIILDEMVKKDREQL